MSPVVEAVVVGGACSGGCSIQLSVVEATVLEGGKSCLVRLLVWWSNQ